MRWLVFNRETGILLATLEALHWTDALELLALTGCYDDRDRPHKLRFERVDAEQTDAPIGGEA